MGFKSPNHPFTGHKVSSGHGIKHPPNNTASRQEEPKLVKRTSKGTRSKHGVSSSTYFTGIMFLSEQILMVASG